MEERIHARLSPSKAGRWINCPASIMLEENLPDELKPSISSYAAEGTLAHMIAERILTGESYDDLMRADLFKSEMLDYVKTYTDYILGRNGNIFVESRVDIPNVPRCFGTADCIIYSKGSKYLEVVDFKYGQYFKIQARDNMQGLLYAIGALKKFAPDVEKVRVTFIQPRMDNIDSTEYTIDELKEFNDKAELAAYKALSGLAEPTKGTWCSFCPCKPLCKAASEDVLDSVRVAIKSSLTPEELCGMYDDICNIYKWAEQAKQAVLALAKNGKAVNGYTYQATFGKRKWCMEEPEMLNTLKKFGVDVPLRRVLPTVSEVEKSIGKKAFKEHLSGFVTREAANGVLKPNEDLKEVFE